MEQKRYDTILKLVCGCELVALEPKVPGGNPLRKHVKIPCPEHDYGVVS